MEKSATDVTYWTDKALQVLAWIINQVGGLLTPQQWGLILVLMAATFAATYILKLIYFSTINEPHHNKRHVRLLAVASGFFAAWKMRSSSAMLADWVLVGMMVGPLSIGLYHLADMAYLGTMDLLKTRFPGLAKLMAKFYPYLRGKDRRKKPRL